MITEEFQLTTSGVARGAGCAAATVRTHADAGLVEFIRMENGTRLFRKSAIDVVQKIVADRIARRGRRAG